MKSRSDRDAPQLVYAATPSRLAHKVPEIMRFVADKGHAPLQPLRAFPIEYFENGAPGRPMTLHWCCRLIDIADQFWLLGISEGTLFEVDHLMKTGRRAAFVDFSEIFDGEAALLQPRLRELLDAAPPA